MKYAGDITAEDKADFLKAIYEGQNRQQAAEQLDSTGTQFRRLCNSTSEHYDPAFAEAYKVAITSEHHERGRLEEIRDLVWKRARDGDTRMIEKLALIYDPDWRELRHQNLNVNVQLAARMLPHISTAELERALAELEAEKEPPKLIEASREDEAA
jgi:multidrug efflux pump subunit AcrB